MFSCDNPVELPWSCYWHPDHPSLSQVHHQEFPPTIMANHPAFPSKIMANQMPSSQIHGESPCVLLKLRPVILFPSKNHDESHVFPPQII